MEPRPATIEPTAVEREGSSQEVLARLPVKSLSAVLGGLAALGLADSADAIVSDGGFSSKSSKSNGEGSSASSGSAKQTPARQASPPANSSSDRESGTSYAVSRGAQRSSSSSGSGSSGSSGSGSSGSSGSGSGSSRSSGSSGSSGGDPANLRGLRGPSGQSSKGSSGASRSSSSSGSSSSGSSGSSSSSSYTLDRPAGSREGRSTSDDREETSSRAVSRGAKRTSSSSSRSASSGGSGSSGSYAPPSRTDASDGYAGMGVGAGAGGSTGASSSESPASESAGSRPPVRPSSRSSGSSRTVDRPADSGEGRSSSSYSGGSSSDRPSQQASPPPGAQPAPGDSPTPVWTGPRWPRGEGSSEQDAGRAVKRAQGDADGGVRSTQRSDTPEDDLRRAGRQVGRSAREAVGAVGRAAAKGADTGEAAGRTVRGAVDGLPHRSQPPKGFKRTPDGKLLPIPRPHKPNRGWPSSAPRIPAATRAIESDRGDDEDEKGGVERFLGGTFDGGKDAVDQAWDATADARTGLRKGGQDVGREASDIGGFVERSLNVTDGKDFKRQWSETAKTTDELLTTDVRDVAKSTAHSFTKPIKDSYRSGGTEEAVARGVPGAVAAVLGGKGLTKLGKLRRGGNRDSQGEPRNPPRWLDDPDIVPENDGVAPKKPPPTWRDPPPSPLSKVVIMRKPSPGSVRYSRTGRDGRSSTWSPGPQASRTGPGPRNSTGPGRLVIHRPGGDPRDGMTATRPDPGEWARKYEPRSIRNSRRTERKKAWVGVLEEVLGAFDLEEAAKRGRGK